MLSGVKNHSQENPLGTRLYDMRTPVPRKQLDYERHRKN